ncbi:hypothetical protein HPB49_004287 [Dermacentor silvarum]|uniref:Uncharacterized protein n=1 Tax=Dermacentor silvarum TaxID=543639 RepID=A0ACB8D2W6_DERSI|nr:hypothetical protein HPB49_004287 [Dermacentor silvarum]
MDRLKAKRSARRTQSAKIINEATTLLESGCNDRTAFSKVIYKLVANRDELQEINAELEDVISVEDLEREYESAAHYDDQTLETLTRLRARLEDLSIGSTVQTPPSTTPNKPSAPTTVSSESFGPRLPTLSINPFHEREIRKEDPYLFKFLWFDKSMDMFRSWIVGSNETSYIRDIFNGGSQRTFIKEDLVARLGLNIIRETCLAVNTFASDAPSRVRKCNVVEVRPRSQFDDSEHIIEAIAMPVICHDISTTAMQCSFATKLREQSYRLADDQTVPRGCGEKGISLLLGSDQLWNILSGDIIRSTEVQGLVAVKTTFG